ncbi:MAG: very short patch repair endonuclease, partial [Gammaproteobacteria bacterium]|nr:very short patch repair endonuclease [Gammaproteobacteria bacterium]
HEGCPHATTRATRPEFWQAKLDDNVQRDTRSNQLLEAGWRDPTVCECALCGNEHPVTVRALGQWVQGSALEYETTPHKPRVANPNRKA